MLEKLLIHFNFFKTPFISFCVCVCELYFPFLFFSRFLLYFDISSKYEYGVYANFVAITFEVALLFVVISNYIENTKHRRLLKR